MTPSAPPQQVLEPSVVWQDDGHLSDVALTIVTDGQDGLLGPDAFAHLDGCDQCLGRLGAHAEVAAFVGEAIVQGERAKSAARHAIPWPALMAAAVVALIGALPSLTSSQGVLARIAHLSSKSVPIVTRASLAIVHGNVVVGPLLVLAVGLSWLVLFGTGVFVARREPVTFRMKGKFQ
jgi:hypothetical protein